MSHLKFRPPWLQQCRHTILFHNSQYCLKLHLYILDILLRKFFWRFMMGCRNMNNGSQLWQCPSIHTRFCSRLWLWKQGKETQPHRPRWLWLPTPQRWLKTTANIENLYTLVDCCLMDHATRQKSQGLA